MQLRRNVSVASGSSVWVREWGGGDSLDDDAKTGCDIKLVGLARDIEMVDVWSVDGGSKAGCICR